MDRSAASSRAALLGLLTAVALVVAALAVPPLTGWHVHARADRDGGVAPLHGLWRPEVGIGTPIALLLGVLGVWRGPELAARLSWRRLLLLSVAASCAWMLALALTEGAHGLTHVLGNPDEYLRTARAVDDVGAFLHGFVDRIPYAAAPDNWPIHVAGHPAGMTLFFVGLVRLGLGGDLAAALVVVAIASTVPAAVLVAVRALGAEGAARRAAPFLVLTPAAIFLAVSADAVMTAVAAWGLAMLALAATRPARRGWPWAVLAGLLLGCAVELSYGLPLAGVMALAVLVLAGRWWPLPVAAVAALVPVLALAAGGFAWWEAFPVLRERYWDGIASDRPASYWIWANLGALFLACGVLVGAGLARLPRARHTERVVVWLAGSAAVAVVLADLSQMSKAEVERIWLPFMPWLTLSLALLPTSWLRSALAVQVVSALVLETLLYTSW